MSDKSLLIFEILKSLKFFSYERLKLVRELILKPVRDTNTHFLLVESSALCPFLSEALMDLFNYGSIDLKEYSHMTFELKKKKTLVVNPILSKLNIIHLQDNKGKVLMRDGRFSKVDDVGFCVFVCKGESNDIPNVIKNIFDLFKKMSGEVYDYDTSFDKQNNFHFVKIHR